MRGAVGLPEWSALVWVTCAAESWNGVTSKNEQDLSKTQKTEEPMITVLESNITDENVNEKEQVDQQNTNPNVKETTQDGKLTQESVKDKDGVAKAFDRA